jgi:hypothetical protein
MTSSLPLAAGQQPPDEAATVAAWLKGYDAAFNAKDLDKLATITSVLS